MDTRINIITVQNIIPGQIKSGIELKIPANFKTLEEIAFSATTEGDASKGFKLGQITLHTNNRKNNPLQYEVKVKKFENMRRKFSWLNMRSEKLIGNTLITADYLDTHHSPLKAPYNLKIYIKGIIE